MNATEQREFDPLIDERPSRYVVGIDLGTTNSAVAYGVAATLRELRGFKLSMLPLPESWNRRERGGPRRNLHRI